MAKRSAAQKRRETKRRAKERRLANAPLDKQAVNQLLARERRGEIKTAEQRQRLAKAYEQSQRTARRASKHTQRAQNTPTRRW